MSGCCFVNSHINWQRMLMLSVAVKVESKRPSISSKASPSLTFGMVDSSQADPVSLALVLLSYFLRFCESEEPLSLLWLLSSESELAVSAAGAAGAGCIICGIMKGGCIICGIMKGAIINGFCTPAAAGAGFAAVRAFFFNFLERFFPM